MGPLFIPPHPTPISTLPRNLLQTSNLPFLPAPPPPIPRTTDNPQQRTHTRASRPQRTSRRIRLRDQFVELEGGAVGAGEAVADEGGEGFFGGEGGGGRCCWGEGWGDDWGKLRGLRGRC